MRRLLLALVLAAGCGARTDLHLEEREGPDAGFFQTFPCRWSLGERLELARGGPFTELTGAAHPVRSEVALLASAGEARVGARVSMGASPARLASLEGHAGRLFTGPLGWLRQDARGCGLVAHDERFAEVGGVAWSTSGSCALTQAVGGRIESLPLTGGAVVSVAFPSVVPLVEIEEERSGGAVAYSPGEGVLVALETRTGLAIARPPDRLFLDGASAVSVAPDRLRGGTLVLHRGPDGRFELGHLRWGGSFELVRRAALGEHEPAGSLASNETEALVPLRDGSMLFVVLSHFEQRVTEPVEPGGVDAMEIVLRPGESAGGLLYTHRLASGESRLVFRSLVCNR